MSKSQLVKSVTRAIELLLALERGPQSLGRLVDQTGLSKATAHRLLTSLGFGQLVIQDPASGEYLLGPGCFGIGDAVIRGHGGLNVIAGSVLERLRDQSQETVTLHVLAGRLRICVGQIPSPKPIMFVAQVGAARPLYLGAMGKVLLAFTPEEIRNEILDRTSLDRVTDATITDREELNREMKRIQSAGYAVSRGENVVGAAAISAPVFGSHGGVLAALSILGPDNRLTDSHLRDLLPLLLEAARDISKLAEASTHDDGPAVARVQP